MKTNERIGRLTEIQQAETLLLDNKEIGRIDFTLTLESKKAQQMYALEGDGTAYHTLESDARFRIGIALICQVVEDQEGQLKTVGVRLQDTADASGKQETDIARLKDKAMRNMSLTRGELHALHAAFDPQSPQACAIAVQLKRQHGDTTLAISEKVCLCVKCRATFELDSPRYTFGWGKTRCPKCGKNVNFDVVDPLPREPVEEVSHSVEEVMKRIREKFGN